MFCDSILKTCECLHTVLSPVVVTPFILIIPSSAMLHEKYSVSWTSNNLLKKKNNNRDNENKLFNFPITYSSSLCDLAKSKTLSDTELLFLLPSNLSFSQ